jgi:hypothetical protein
VPLLLRPCLLISYHITSLNAVQNILLISARAMSKDARTVSVSEFLSFLFKSQLVEDSSEEQILAAHPELKGLSGMQLKTFRDSSAPLRETSLEDELYGSRRGTFNRSRFSSEYAEPPKSPRSTYSSSSSTSDRSPSAESGQGWRVYGTSHSRQSSTVRQSNYSGECRLISSQSISGIHQ